MNAPQTPTPTASIARLLLALGFLTLTGAFAACNCGPSTSLRFPELDVQEEQVDFGTVQINVEYEKQLRIYNAGTGDLNISEFRVEEPFGFRPPDSMTVRSGQELLLTLTFKPTEEDTRYTKSLIIASNDPDSPEHTVALVGVGISAAATASPNPIDFGDVYAGESKTVPVSITNGGSNELIVLGAAFTQETPAAVTSDLSAISSNIPAGATRTVQVKFAPTAMMDMVPGALRLELDPEQGGELLIPFKGRGVRAIPRLCFQFDGVPMERCTDANASGMGGGGLPIDFGALCDALIYPPDAGPPPTSCGSSPYELSGRLYVRNEGNIPVSYSVKYTSDVEKRSCDGGIPDRIDFQFSNAPDAGAFTWDEATVKLPALPGDPKPWETSGVTITYRATAECPDEAADQAQVVWTRQGDLRQPTSLVAFISGKSKLPQAVAAGVSVTGKAPSEAPFYGAGNRGIAEFQVTDVKLFEVVSGTPGGNCAGPDAGVFQACDHTNPISDCYQFGWADGGDPNVNAPHSIPVDPDGGLGQVRIGTVVFSPNGGANSNTEYCVYSVVQTTDPFHPEIVSRIQGVRTQ